MLNTLEMRLGAAATATRRWCSISCATCGRPAVELVSQLIADLVRQQMSASGACTWPSTIAASSPP